MQELNHYSIIWNDRDDSDPVRVKSLPHTKLFSTRVDIPKLTLEYDDIAMSNMPDASPESKIYADVMMHLGIVLPNYRNFFVSIERADVTFIGSPVLNLIDYVNDEIGSLQVIYSIGGRDRGFVVEAFLGQGRVYLHGSSDTIFLDEFKAHGNDEALWDTEDVQLRATFFEKKTGSIFQVCPYCRTVMAPTPTGMYYCTNCA